MSSTGLPIRFLRVLTILISMSLAGQPPAKAAESTNVDSGLAERKAKDRERKQQRAKNQPNLATTARASQDVSASHDPLFTLKSVEIAGASAIRPEALSKAYQAYLGRPVSEADLAKIAEAITQSYQTAGYLLSRAYLPPQDINGGAVRVQVVEGSIGTVLFEGGDANQFGLRKFAAHLSRELPLTRKTFERQLLLINDTPGVEVEDTVLRELGNASGRFELTIVLKTWRIWAQAGMDNRGTDDIGPIQGYATAAANSVLSPGGSAVATISTIPDETNELSFGRLSLEHLVGDNGSKLSFAASRSRLRPNGERRLRNTKIKTDNFTLKGTLVSYRSRERSLWLSLEGGTRLEEERDQSGLIYRDRIRAISLLADLHAQDRLGGMNYLTVNLRQGFSVFGASRAGDQNLSRYDGRGDFTKLFASYYRVQTLRGNWSLALSAEAQVSSNALLSSEEFYLGGSSIGRAFEGGEISGDSGLGGVAELRYEQTTERSLLKSWMVYGFVDGGTVWNRNSNGTSTLSLASFGAGARFELPQDIRVGVEVAKPFQEHTWAENGDHVRASVSLSHSVKF